MDAILEKKYGKIVIPQDVVAAVAGLAATECYGLVGMAGRTVADGLAELLGRENLKKGVRIHTVDNVVDIELSIMVSYGTRISEVAQNVQDKVRYTVERTFGLKVDQVSISVQGVKVTKAK